MRKLSLVVLLFVIALVLSACGHEPLVVTHTENAPIIHPPLPAKIAMKDVEWQVVNRDEMLKIVQNPKNDNIVLIALTPRGYENLSENMAELKRYILEQQQVIKYYRALSPTETPTSAESKPPAK